MNDDSLAGRPSGPPTVTGLSPTEGTPGTQVTIRGENLAVDQDDILMLFICGTDCLQTAKWKSPTKIVARIGQANRGLGEVKIATKSGGRGISHVKFRVFIAQVGPLEETAVWVDESRTVPGREAMRVVAPTTDDKDALGLTPSRKIDASILSREFPDGSGNLRMESFNPQWYLLENHSETSIGDLREALKNMELSKANEVKRNEQVHKANLYSLISCVDSLASLHDELERGSQAGEFAVMKSISNQIADARVKAESVFKDVLSRKDRADATRNALSILTRFKFIFFLPKTIDENMKKGEYLTILNDYMRAKALYKDTDVSLFQEVLAQLDAKMDVFKTEMKHKLIDTPASFEEQSKLIKYLKILEPDSDPTWECITAYHCWLENVLWTLQDEHYQRAMKSTSGSHAPFSLVEVNERQAFVSALVSLLVNKLQSFWKLSVSYNTNEERFVQRQDDINQMMTNTINVSSWLILNALVPQALPDKVLAQYKSQFVQWPNISSHISRSVLIHGLKTVRNFISSLMECQFTNIHLQPLIELCMTVRLKVVSDVIDRSVMNIAELSRKETWKQDYVDDLSSKTPVPDLYENEIGECISLVRDALSTSSYPGELCLFYRDGFRTALIDIFVHLVTSIRTCFDRLLNRHDSKRPPNLNLTANKEEDRPQGMVTTKQLLISICNVDYVVNYSLVNITRRMNENGVKCADNIYEKSRAKMNEYKDSMVRSYISHKSRTFKTLIDSAVYAFLPDDDISDFAKEIMMCIVLQQAELQLHAPQLTMECLQSTVENLFKMLIDHLIEHPPIDANSATQCVIDICALEQAFDAYTSLETRARLNGYRADLVNQIDQSKLAHCLNTMRSSMRMVLGSLDSSSPAADLNSSTI